MPIPPNAVDRVAVQLSSKVTPVLLLVGWFATAASAAMAVIDLEDARAGAAELKSLDRQLTAITDTLDAVLAARDSVVARRAREILDSARVLRRRIGDGPDLQVQAAETARTRWLVLAGMMTVAVAGTFLALFMARRERRPQGPL